MPSHAATMMFTGLATLKLKRLETYGTVCRIQSSSLKSGIKAILKANAEFVNIATFVGDVELQHYSLRAIFLVLILNVPIYLKLCGERLNRKMLFNNVECMP
jgi:hypothetical protein